VKVSQPPVSGGPGWPPKPQRGLTPGQWTLPIIALQQMLKDTEPQLTGEKYQTGDAGLSGSPAPTGGPARLPRAQVAGGKRAHVGRGAEARLKHLRFGGVGKGCKRIFLTRTSGIGAMPKRFFKHSAGPMQIICISWRQNVGCQAADAGFWHAFWHQKIKFAGLES
jgi:hypothetical protein